MPLGSNGYNLSNIGGCCDSLGLSPHKRDVQLRVRVLPPNGLSRLDAVGYPAEPSSYSSLESCDSPTGTSR